jgi:hypothetical protein
MGGETPADAALALDVERARQLAEVCGAVGDTAGRLHDDVRSLLAAARQPSSAAPLLAAVHEELTKLRRLIAGAVESAERADRWWTVDPAAWSGWVRMLLTEASLWNDLNDSIGASALDVGGFELAGSFRSIGDAEWRSATTSVGCESFGTGRYYSGGGGLLGPDGRVYPIVVPHLVIDDRHHFTADADPGRSTPNVGSLGGGDPGWDLIGYRTGTERIESAPTPWLKIVTGIAVATGLDIGAGVDAGQLAGIHLRAGSRAQFSATAPGLTPVDLSVMTDGSAVTSPRAPVAAGVLSLTIGAATGYVAARDLDDRGQRAYEVMFEQHADGRLRARVQTFTLESGPRGVGLYGWHLFLDADGDLHQSPISYPAVDSIHPPDVLFAGNRYDPDHTWRLPNADFGGNHE